MKKFKRIIALVLTLCLIMSVPVSANRYYTPQMLAKEKAAIKKVSTLAKPQNVKIYRSVEAALIEWDKVEGAKSYKIYRKAKDGKYVYLGKVNEKYFTAMQDYKNTRFFIDIRYKKKKTKKYNYKKKYTYKVVAVNGKVKASSTKVSKKHKKKKAEPSYYTLYLVNKKRTKAGYKPMYWGHSYEKGCRTRVKEIRKKFSHDRPVKHEYWGNGCDVVWMNLRLFDPWELSFYNLGVYGENIGYSSAGTEDVIYDGYWNSPGHKAIMMYSGKGEIDKKSEYWQINDARVFTEKGGNFERNTFSLTAYTYSSNIAKKDNLVYHEMVVGEDEYVVANNYGNTYSAESRAKKDESIKLPSYLYESYPYIVPLPLFRNYRDSYPNYYNNTNPKAVNDLLYKAGYCYDAELMENYMNMSYNDDVTIKDWDWGWMYDIKKAFYAAHGVNIDKLN